MNTNETKVIIEKERTKRVAKYEKIAIRISLIAATVLLAVAMLVTFAATVY